MQFSSLLFFSVSTPPSRKRQGGVNRVPQALQACILVLSSHSSLVPRSRRRVANRSDHVAVLYHNRASPKLDISVRPLCPTLSVSDAEHGVYHDCSLSETATTAVSTTRLRSRVGILTSSSGEWLGKKRLRLGYWL